MFMKFGNRSAYAIWNIQTWKMKVDFKLNLIELKKLIAQTGFTKCIGRTVIGKNLKGVILISNSNNHLVNENKFSLDVNPCLH